MNQRNRPFHHFKPKDKPAITPSLFEQSCEMVPSEDNGDAPLITIRCPGLPVAQPRQRQRVITIAGRAMAANYTPTKSPVNEFKAALKFAASRAYEGPPLTGPLTVNVTCVFPRPSNVVWKSKPMTRLPHAKKPDADNLCKSVFDALNAIIWRDDAQIYAGTFQKVIASGDESPHVLVEVWNSQEPPISMKRKRSTKPTSRVETETTVPATLLPGERIRLLDLHKPEILLQGIDLEQWGWHSRWILLACGRRDYVAAHKALDSFIAGSVPGSLSLDSSIWMLSQQLPYRLLEALESGGYETLRSLDGATDEELRQCDHCGDKHVFMIRNALEQALELMIAAMDREG